jgi:hypothetical protein
MENAPDGLVQLIDRFKEHLEQYTGASYDEANTRTDFIDPLFELLGWDVVQRGNCVCTDCEKSGFQLQIAALDRAIDSLVCRLHGLDDEALDMLASERQ